MKTLWWGAIVLWVGLLSLATAHAEDPPFGYGISQQVLAGEPVTLTFQPNVGLDYVNITVSRRGDRKEWQFTARNLGPGDAREFTWDQPAGTHGYKMEVVAGSPDGATFEGSTTFEVVSLTAMEVKLDHRASSLDDGELYFIASRGVASAELEAFGENKVHIDSVSKEIGGSREFGVKWDPKGQKNVYVKVKLFDDGATWVSMDVFRLEIPHEDVVFDTNESTVRADQEPKLAETLEYILDAQRTYDDVAMELYVAGYTDTVGSPGDNQSLSEKRAKSIARWFRQKLSIPVFYQGFGESVLAVATPDNTDEERNRRAIYLLTNSPPGTTPSFPQSKWSPVK